jgi:hypothetical protein
MEAKRDENYRTALIGVDENGVVKPLLVDPITGYLLCISSEEDCPAFSLTEDGFRDENNVVTGLGVDSNGVVRPLLINPTNGDLLITQ